MSKPTALQRLAQELKTFDWHHDPNKTNTPAARQEAKIKRIIAKCKPQEVWELWEAVAPSKFPTPFGLKPKKQKKLSKTKPGLGVDPSKAFQRRVELGLPDPSGEVERWQVLAALTRLADENGCTVHELTNDQLKTIGKLKLYTPELKAEAERERLAYRSHSLQDPQVLEIIVGYVTEGTIPPDQLRKIYGEVGAMRVLSEVQRRVDSKVYEVASSRDGKPTDSANRGATKGSTMKNDKNNPNKNGISSKRVLVLGYTLTGFSQWMAKEGHDFAAIVKVLNGLGVEGAKDSTIKTAISDVRNPKYARPADVSKEHQAEVKKLVGTKTPSKAPAAGNAKGQPKAPNTPKAKASDKAPSKPAKAPEPPKATKGPTKAKASPAKPTKAPSKAKGGKVAAK